MVTTVLLRPGLSGKAFGVPEVKQNMEDRLRAQECTSARSFSLRKPL